MAGTFIAGDWTKAEKGQGLSRRLFFGSKVKKTGKDIDKDVEQSKQKTDDIKAGDGKSIENSGFIKKKVAADPKVYCFVVINERANPRTSSCFTSQSQCQSAE